MSNHIYNLTDADIAICDAYQDLMWRIIERGPTSAGGCVINHMGEALPSISVHDEYRAYTPDYYDGPPSVACDLQGAIDKYAAANPADETQDEYRARRAAELRAELAKLEGAAA